MIAYLETRYTTSRTEGRGEKYHEKERERAENLRRLEIQV